MLAGRANEARRSVTAARRVRGADRGRQPWVREARHGWLCGRGFDVSPRVRETHISWVFLAGERAERAVQRDRDPSEVSGATLSVVLSERLTWEPLEEVHGDDHVTLRTDRPLPRIPADLTAFLDLRLA